MLDSDLQYCQFLQRVSIACYAERCIIGWSKKIFLSKFSSSHPLKLLHLLRKVAVQNISAIQKYLGVAQQSQNLGYGACLSKASKQCVVMIHAQNVS